MQSKSLKFDLRLAAKALCLREKDMMKIFRDGRTCAQMAPSWVTQMFGEVDESCRIRVLTKSGVKFQDSRHLGTQRRCNISRLRHSINRYTEFVVLDIRTFPTIRGWMLDKNAILGWVADGTLTEKGLTAKKSIGLMEII